MDKEMWQARMVISSATVGVLAVFLSGGWLLDRQFGTWPKIFLLALVVSFPFAQFLILKLLWRRQAKRKKA